MKLLLRALALLFSLSLVAGCVAQPVKSIPAREAQLIVKFKPRVVAPSDATFLANLSRDIGAPLTYLREMAGPAHILKLGYDTEAELNNALAQLNRHSDVEYAELDRMMRITQ